MVPLSTRQNAFAFNQPLSFDTSSVTDMGQMFMLASAFNQPLSFDTSSVTDMASMFVRASAFNQPLNLDTSSVTSMTSMFNYASAFNQPLSFDISSVTGMQWMFDGTDSLSDANKLFIRCAWSGSATFVSQYGSEWGRLGACSPPLPPPSPPLLPPSPPPRPVPRAVVQPRQCVTMADGVSRCIQIQEGLSLDDEDVQAMIEHHFASSSPSQPQSSPSVE